MTEINTVRYILIFSIAVVIIVLATIDWYITKKYTRYISTREYKKLTKKDKTSCSYRLVGCYSCNKVIKPRRYYYNPYNPFIEHVCNDNKCQMIAY